MPYVRPARSAQQRLKRRRGRTADDRFAVWPTINLKTPLALGVSFVVGTFVATLLGMRYMYDFKRGQSPLTSLDDILPYRWDLSHLNLIAGGLPFALTLVCILLAYQLARFYACRYYGVSADLPFVPTRKSVPAESTVSRMKSRSGPRTAAITIAAVGPAASFVIACATACYGLVHSSPIARSAAPSLVHISVPLLFKVLRRTLLASYPDIPPIVQMSPHPMLIASWIGLVFTASNLIPAGRLDGGRIIYAISPRWHRITSMLSIGVLLYLGTVEWAGWLLWAGLILLTGIGHREKRRMPGDRSSGQTGVQLEFLALAPLALAIFALCASTQPVTGMSLVQLLLGIHWGL